jgi:hypothetical protein
VTPNVGVILNQITHIPRIRPREMTEHFQNQIHLGVPTLGVDGIYLPLNYSSRPSKQRPEQRSHKSCPSPQWLAEPTLTERTEARTAHSHVVPAKIVARYSHAVQANTGKSSAVNCRARHHCGLLSQRRPSEQRPEKRPHLSRPPTHWLAEPTQTERTEAREAPSTVVPATTVPG